MVSHTGGTNIYDVDFPGMPFSFALDAAVCTSSTATRIVSVNSIGANDLRLSVTDGAGAGAETSIYCAVYNLN